MDAYTTEQEQLEQIKKWWNENGKAIVLGLALGLGGLFGYRYWEAARLADGQSASINYEHLLGIAAAGASDEATAAGEAIIDAYPKSTYAKLSALVLAKLAVDVRNIEEAKKRLQWVIDHSQAGKIKPVAQARLAQLLLAEGKTDDAAALITQIDSTHALQFAELRGDLHAAQKEREKARALYSQALAEVRERGGNGQSIELKLDNLNVTTR
ncbi:MAG TPA: tetratricopeptide repeat protein [Gammaproteobacteria bacterium]|nr:tetratricopeptide repeat protein [Gammaproteobacteria bacterium]